MSKPKPESKLILSLDGGGIRGAASAQFLVRVEQALNDKKTSIRECVDFYAGTSTGSIIALALATTDLTIDEISDLYSPDSAEKIFVENKGLFEWDGINAPKYEASGKTSFLQQKFGAQTIDDAVKKGKHVLAVCYGIEKRKPVVIKSTDPQFLDLLAYQAADASSAAPTYFPTKELDIGKTKYWMVDGGVTTNNPTMCAIVEAKQKWKSIDKLRVLSIGTGYRAGNINGRNSQKWGILEWAIKGHILDVLTDERIVSYQARTIIKKGNYIRVNADLKKQDWLPNPPDGAMDNISKKNIGRLRKLGDFWFAQYGTATVKLLLGKSLPNSLEGIDSKKGTPKNV